MLIQSTKKVLRIVHYLDDNPKLCPGVVIMIVINQNLPGLSENFGESREVKMSQR